MAQATPALSWPVVDAFAAASGTDGQTRANIGAYGVFLVTGTTTADLGRTPNIFKTASATAAGSTALWTPAAGKKFRLMRFIIALTANASLAAAAIELIDLLDAAASIGLTQSHFVNNAAATTLGAYTYGWIDLGNGYLSTAANNVLNVNLGTALATGACRVVACGTEE